MSNLRMTRTQNRLNQLYFDKFKVLADEAFTKSRTMNLEQTVSLGKAYSALWMQYAFNINNKKGNVYHCDPYYFDREFKAVIRSKQSWWQRLLNINYNVL